MSHFDRFHGEDLTVIVSELLVATADHADPLLDSTVGEVLRSLRERLALDVVFVSEFTEGRRIFRYVDRAARAPALRPGDSGPLEESFCIRMVDGRLPGLIHDAAALPANLDVPPVPFRVGGHLSVPIVLADGSTYGTLCCFSTAPRPDLRQKDLETLRLCASLVVRKLELVKRVGLAAPDWQLEPIEPCRPPVRKLR